MPEQERQGRLAEISVLGGMLLGGPEAVDRTAVLEPADFFERADQLLFRTVWDVRAREEAVDAVAVHEELVARGQSERVGGSEYLADLLDVAVTATDIDSYVRIVQAASEDRRRQRRVDALRRDLEKGVAELGRGQDPLAAVAEIQGDLEVFREEYEGRAGSRVVPLFQILANPDFGNPPEPVVDRLAWRGRVTLLYAREKAGKSTLASAAAASLTAGGKFMGEGLHAAPVLWYGPEEHPLDAARRFMDFGANPETLYVLEYVLDPLREIEAAVAELSPALVVIDTLSAYAEEARPESGSATDWKGIMAPLVRLARQEDVAILILHHATKVGGEYRDSTAIGAEVDMLVEMTEGDVEGTRELKPKGRWKVEPFTVLYREEPGTTHWFQFTEGEMSVDVKVLLFVKNNPGCSQRSVEEGVSGNRGAIRDAVRRLCRNAIEDRGDGSSGMKLYPRAESSENPHGRGPGAPPAHPGRAPEAQVRPKGGSPPKGGAPRARPPDVPRGAESDQQEFHIP